MNIIDVFAGFVASLLAAMGVGGGGLLVIYLTELAGIDQRTAQGINLIFFLCASVAAMSVHLRKRKLAYSAALFFSIGGALGAIIGCTIAQKADNAILRRGFGILLLFAGSVTLYKTFSAWIRKRNSAKL